MNKEELLEEHTHGLEETIDVYWNWARKDGLDDSDLKRVLDTIRGRM